MGSSGLFCVSGLAPSSQCCRFLSRGHAAHVPRDDPRLLCERQSPSTSLVTPRAGLFNSSLFTLGVTLGQDSHVARCCEVCRKPWARLPSNLDRPALKTSGATPERAMLEGVIPFQARVHLPWERLPGRTPLCALGVIPFKRAPSPRPRTKSC